MTDGSPSLSAMSSLSPEPQEVLQKLEQPPAPCSHPSQSWDVAFIFAFLTRFTAIFQQATWPSTVHHFEAAFLAPAEQSSTLDVPTLEPVVDWLVFNLLRGHIPKPDHKKKGKRNFLLELSDLLMVDLASSLSERWNGINKLKDEADGWVLNLGWEDRAVMIRNMCEWALAHSPYIRDQVYLHYNLQPQRVVRRRPEENALIIAPIGRDQHRNSYYRLDDSPRIYKAGSTYSSSSIWVPMSDSAQDILTLASSLGPAPSPAKSKGKSPSKATGPEVELKNYLENEVVPSLPDCAARLKAIRAEHDASIKAQDRLDRQSHAHLQPGLPDAGAADASFQDDASLASSTGSRRAAAKRVNYKDVEDGRLAVTGPAKEKRGTKRPRASDQLEFEDDGSRRSSRTNKGAAPSRFGQDRHKAAVQHAEEELNRRRSSRVSRGARGDDEDAVALVQAYLASAGDENGDMSMAADSSMAVDQSADLGNGGQDTSMAVDGAPTGAESTTSGFEASNGQSQDQNGDAAPVSEFSVPSEPRQVQNAPAEPAQESTAPQVAEASVEDKSAAAATSHAAPETASSDQPPPAEQDPPSAVPPEGAPSAADAATGQ